MTCIQTTFGKPKVLLPVLHLPHGVEGAMRSVDHCISAGVDGVFLINQGMTAGEVMNLVSHIQRTHPGLWVGANLLRVSPHEVVLDWAPGRNLGGIWSDDCGVDSAPYHGDEWEYSANRWGYAKSQSGWSGLYFGGTAFKTQKTVPWRHLPEVAARASTFVDVITTSGAGTGIAAHPEKVRILRNALGNHPLALASGVTPDNVGVYLPNVDAFLVASGIEASFGVLDPIKVRDLAQAIHQ